MKLLKVLEKLNSIEKNSFIKIIETLISENSGKTHDIDNILNSADGSLKNTDNLNIAKIFSVLESSYQTKLKQVFSRATSQLDIIADILTKDGNCIMKREWFAQLYSAEIEALNNKIIDFDKQTNDDNSTIEPTRLRDYKIYKSCLKIAYENDQMHNQDCKITSDEQDILHVLANELSLSLDEKKLINYSIIPPLKLDIDELIDSLKSIGTIFYSKKNNIIYVPDEIVSLLRRIQGKEVADKYFRWILKALREPQINLICKKYNIDWRASIESKIKAIIANGISFSKILSQDIYKENTKISDIKKFLNEFCEKKLLITLNSKGVTIEDKIANIIQYIEQIEQDEKISISMDGYEKLLLDLVKFLPEANSLIKYEFQLQEENVCSSAYLTDHNIKPKDVLFIIPENSLYTFCEALAISTRGNCIHNIIENYKDAESIYIDNYVSIGYRDQAQLKENGINIKEAELGIKFEDITKLLLAKIGLNVNEELRKKLNNNKNQIDIVIAISNDEIILIECKTIKEQGYNKFSSVARQLKSYVSLCNTKNYKVIKSLIVAPEFSNDFIKECGLDLELNISLITASTLVSIVDGFKQSKLKKFPHNLIMRDVVINDETILNALSK